MSNVNIKINTFVKRQTKESRFSYYDGSENELLSLVTANFHNAKPGYRDGVILVPVPSKGFFSSICKIDSNSVLESKMESRHNDEEPVLITVVKNGEKLPAKEVNIVLYRHDVLMEDNSASSNADWEIISINASLVVGGEPMTPTAMARNFLKKQGGTAATYTAEQFAESVWFWSQHAMCAEK